MIFMLILNFSNFVTNKFIVCSSSNHSLEFTEN